MEPSILYIGRDNEIVWLLETDRERPGSWRAEDLSGLTSIQLTFRRVLRSPEEDDEVTDPPLSDPVTMLSDDYGGLGAGLAFDNSQARGRGHLVLTLGTQLPTELEAGRYTVDLIVFGTFGDKPRSNGFVVGADIDLLIR